jgi:hypothetical protein
MASSTVKATFTASDTATVVYSGITSTAPEIIPSIPTVTDGLGVALVSVNGAPTSTSLSLAASRAFTGYVTIIVSD